MSGAPVKVRKTVPVAEACQFARFDATGTPCEGRLVRCHLIPQQMIRRELKALHVGRGKDLELAVWDPRVWVWGCGGISHGNLGHHGMFDNFKLTVPRDALPPAVWEFAREWDNKLSEHHGKFIAPLDSYLLRHYA